MKKKEKSRIINMFDSCIFIEVHCMGNLNETCKEIIGKYKTGIMFNPIILGEIKNILHKKIDTDDIYVEVMLQIRKILKRSNIKTVDIIEKTLEINKKLKSLNLSIHDSLILSSAIEHKCDGFVTMDEKIIDQKDNIKKIYKDENEKNLKIFTPEEFLNSTSN